MAELATEIEITGPKGANASAAVHSIIETAKANELNPYEYLKFIFEHLPGVQFVAHPEFLRNLFHVIRRYNPPVKRIKYKLQCLT